MTSATSNSAASTPAPAAPTKKETTTAAAVTDDSNDPYKYDDQRRATMAYVDSKRIRELLKHLMELLIYKQPEDPKAFLFHELMQMRKKAYTDLVEDSDLETIFSMIDINRTGHIKGSQMKLAAKNLHVPISTAILNTPDEAKIDAKQFKQFLNRNFDVLDDTQYMR